MCGLLGIAGPGINQQDINIFKELGMVSQLRGEDGAGVYQIKSNTTHKNQKDFEEIYKTSGNFQDLLYDVSTSKKTHLMESVMVDIIMGHVRAATRGSVIQSNAHPFVCRNIVGMHNGTLRDERYRHVSKTDSEMMMNDISWNGIPEVLSRLDKESAYAIVIYDREEKCLFFAKNSKRPLHFALLKSRNVMYWASEKLMLQLVLKRRNIEADYFSIKDNVIYRLRPQRIDHTKPDKIFSIVEDLNPPEPVQSNPPSTNLTVVSQQPIMGPVSHITGPTVDQVVKDIAKDLENKKAEDKETKNVSTTHSEGKVIPLIKPRERSEHKEKQPLYAKGDTRQYHLFCDCGKDSLNLFEAYMCKQGAAGYPKFQPETNTFACQVCK